MRTIRERIQAALAGVCDCVVYGYPLDLADASRVCWRESQNRRYAQADGREHLTEVNYTVDVFAPDAEACDALSEACDARMIETGLRREDRRAVFDADCAHISMRYRALLGADGGIYQ